VPIFEYQCQACGHRMDALQGAAEPALRKCPQCGRLKLIKNVSAPAFQLRGSGWRKSPEVGAPKARRRVGHVLDSGPPHSHDHDESHSHGGGHTHSRGGHTHTHGPGHKHGHSN